MTAQKIKLKPVKKRAAVRCLRVIDVAFTKLLKVS